jgi:hypothetical protein
MKDTPYAARYLYRQAGDTSQFPAWRVMTAALGDKELAGQLVAAHNHADKGRFVWKFEECLPTDYDYPLSNLSTKLQNTSCQQSL